MDNKQQALNQIISLIKSEQISVAEIENALQKNSTVDERNSGIIRVLGYLGGLFIITGIAVYVSMHWDELNSVARVLVTLGIGYVLYLAGVAVAYKENISFSSAPLFIIAAVLQTLGLFVFLEEYFHSSNQWEPACMFVFGILLVQYFFSFLALKKQVLLFFALTFSANFIYVFLSWLKIPEEQCTVIVGLYLLVNAFYLDKTPHKATTPFWNLIGSLMLMGGLFCVLKDKPYELVYVLIGCSLVSLSVWAKSRVLLLVSTLSIFAYICYFTEKYFVNSIGWPLSLIVLGLVLFALSLGAYKINNFYIKHSTV